MKGYPKLHLKNISIELISVRYEDPKKLVVYDVLDNRER